MELQAYLQRLAPSIGVSEHALLIGLTLLVLAVSTAIASLIAEQRNALSRYPVYPAWAHRAHLSYSLLDLFSTEGPSTALATAHQRLNTPILRTGPKRVHLSQASARLTRELGSCDKAPSYAAFDIAGCSTLFSVRERSEHAARAKVVAALFSREQVKTHEELIFEAAQQTVDVLRQHLDDKPDGRAKVNLLALFRSFAIDVASQIYMGSGYGALASLKPGSEYVFAAQVDIGIIHDAFNDDVPLNMLSAKRSASIRAVRDRMLAALRHVGLHRETAEQQAHAERLGAAITCYESYLNSIIDDALADKAAPPYISALLSSTAYASLSKEQKHEALHAECADLLFAGTESLASTLAVGLLHLYTPSAATSLKSLQCSLKVSEPLALSDVESNVILQATLREALRLTSPVPRALDRIVGSKGLRLDDGNVLPQGTVVGLGQHTVHSDEGIFPNPERFDASRWLTSTNELRNDVTHIAFGLPGAPSRACIARALAEAELAVMLQAFVRSFVIEKPEVPQGRDLFNLGFEGGLIEAVVRKRETIKQ